MKKNKLNSILAAVCAASFVLFLVSFCSTSKTKPKSVESALLNPAYIEKVSAVLIQSPEEIISIKQENSQWAAEKQGIYTYADTKQIKSLLKNLTKIRKMYKISDKEQGKIELSLTQDSARIITVIDNRGIAVAKLYFGSTSSLTSRINVRSEKGRNCYETEDDISPYLNTDLDFWTVPEIFFAIKEPSNLNIDSSSIKTLLALRHGKIMSSAVLPPNSVKIDSILLKGQYNSSQKIDIYEYSGQDSREYFYIQHIQDEFINNNALYEISQWTYERLKKLLHR